MSFLHLTPVGELPAQFKFLLCVDAQSWVGTVQASYPDCVPLIHLLGNSLRSSISIRKLLTPFYESPLLASMGIRLIVSVPEDQSLQNKV